MIETKFLRFYFIYVLSQENTHDWSICFCWFISLDEKSFGCLLFLSELGKEKSRIVSFATKQKAHFFLALPFMVCLSYGFQDAAVFSSCITAAR